MGTPSQPSAVDLNSQQRFFHYFQQEITALQEQMDRLADTAVTGGERSDAADHCLAGITRLSNEVKDASGNIPPYDQRTYAEAIKALQERLDETRKAFAPKPKFAFKTAHKSPSALSLNDAAELAAEKRRGVPGFLSPDSETNSSFTNTPAYNTTPQNERATEGGRKASTQPKSKDRHRMQPIRRGTQQQTDPPYQQPQPQSPSPTRHIRTSSYLHPHSTPKHRARYQDSQTASSTSPFPPRQPHLSPASPSTTSLHRCSSVVLSPAQPTSLASRTASSSSNAANSACMNVTTSTSTCIAPADLSSRTARAYGLPRCRNFTPT